MAFVTEDGTQLGESALHQSFHRACAALSRSLRPVGSCETPGIYMRCLTLSLIPLLHKQSLSVFHGHDDVCLGGNVKATLVQSRSSAGANLRFGRKAGSQSDSICRAPCPDTIPHEHAYRTNRVANSCLHASQLRLAPSHIRHRGMT